MVVATQSQDVGALQDEIKALEARLAQTRQQGGDMADPDGDYTEEEYYDEVLDDEDVYVIEEIVDDGQQFVDYGDDEIIEIVEYEESEYEELVEEELVEDGPPSPKPRRPTFSSTKSPTPAPAPSSSQTPDPSSSQAPEDDGGKARSNLMASIQSQGGQTDPDSNGGASRPPPAVASNTAGPRAAGVAPAPRAPDVAPKPGGRPGVSFTNVKLRQTGINLAEAEADSPYTAKGPPPRAQPAHSPPKSVAARDAPKPVAKPKSFLQGVQDADDRAATAEDEALKAVQDDNEAQTRKAWVPMKEKDPEKYHKNSIEAREAPKKKTTKLVPLPFRPRQYPSAPVSASGQETAIEKMVGPHVYKNAKLDRITTNSAMKDQEILCLYFGAAWRAGCKAFHSQLVDFYKLTTKDCNLECVYISADRTLFEFKDVYNKFPFLAIPTGTVDLKNQMTKDFKINDLPALVVLNAQTGHLITVDGVEDITNVPTRDRQLCQKLVNDWKQRKANPVQRSGGQNEGPEDSSKQEHAPPKSPPGAVKGVGRKERKGLLFWKKR